MLPTVTVVALVSHLAAAPCAPQGTLETLERSERRLTLEVGDGAGVLVVRDTVPRNARRSGQYEGNVYLPSGTAVGARVHADGAVVEAKLEEDDTASARFGDFSTALTTGVPAEEARGGKLRTAVLADFSSGCCGTDGDRVHVQVATTCGADQLVVETTWVLESEPADGAWRFRIPRELEEDLPLSVRGAAVRKVFVDGTAARVLAHGDGEAVIDVVPIAADVLRGRASVERLEPLSRLAPVPHDDWGKVDGVEVVGPINPVDTVRVEIDVPRPLADPAPALRVVFVMDASRSAGREGIAKARAAMEGVLDALPDDARYAVVAFARQPWLLVDPWSSPRERFLPEVLPQNGSDVVGALSFARRLARDTAPEETPRIVLFSDLMQRRAVTEASWSRALESLGVLTHVVALPSDVVAEEAYSWARLVPDEEPRAEAVEGTGGIFVEIGNGEEPDALLWPHLVAPTRIDEVALEVGGRDPLEGALSSDGELPERLLAGQGVRVQSVLPVGARGEAFMTGFLWSRPLALPLEATAATRRLSLARTANGPVSKDLEDDLVRSAAKAVGAVSRVTSLVHVPEFRPAEPEGLGFGLSGCGCGCCGCCGGFGTSGRSISCGVGTATPIEGELAALEARLAAEAVACGVARAEVRLEIEDKEILEVVMLEGGTCVAERVWQWDLQQISEWEGLEMARVFERHFDLAVRAEAPREEPADADPAEDDEESGEG